MVPLFKNLSLLDESYLSCDDLISMLVSFGLEVLILHLFD